MFSWLVFLLDDLSRDRIPSAARTELERACFAIPWSPPSYLPLTDGLWAECDSIAPPPMPERCNEKLPDVLPAVSPIPILPYKVSGKRKIDARVVTYKLTYKGFRCYGCFPCMYVCVGIY